MVLVFNRGEQVGSYHVTASLATRSGVEAISIGADALA
jgi:hypothetical protein